MPDHNIPIGKGVAMVVPPLNLRASIDRSVLQIAGELPKDKKVAIVAVATRVGANLAIVARVDDIWAVKTYIGKTWDEPLDYGGGIVASW